MPDLAQAIAQIQEWEDQSAQEVERCKRMCADERRYGGRWEDQYRAESWAWRAKRDAYARVLELLKEL